MAIEQIVAVIAEDYEREVDTMVAIGWGCNDARAAVADWWISNVEFAVAVGDRAWASGIGGARQPPSELVATR